MSSSAAADSEGRKLFLGGLPFDVNEDDLRTDMSKFGELEDVQLPFDGGKHKGFAFITFRDPKDCKDASESHHQRPYRGREISARVVVPRGDPAHPDGARGGGAGGERPGDWTCPACGANVFASKMNCFKCNEPKPRGGGGGGGGYGRDRGGYRREDSRDRDYRRRSPSRDRYRRDDYDDRRRGDRDYDDRGRDRDYDDRGREHDRAASSPPSRPSQPPAPFLPPLVRRRDDYDDRRRDYDDRDRGGYDDRR